MPGRPPCRTVADRRRRWRCRPQGCGGDAAVCRRRWRRCRFPRVVIPADVLAAKARVVTRPAVRERRGWLTTPTVRPAAMAGNPLSISPTAMRSGPTSGSVAVVGRTPSAASLVAAVAGRWTGSGVPPPTTPVGSVWVHRRGLRPSRIWRSPTRPARGRRLGWRYHGRQRHRRRRRRPNVGGVPVVRQHGGRVRRQCWWHIRPEPHDGVGGHRWRRWRHSIGTGCRSRGLYGGGGGGGGGEGNTFAGGGGEQRVVKASSSPSPTADQ